MPTILPASPAPHAPAPAACLRTEP